MQAAGKLASNPAKPNLIDDSSGSRPKEAHGELQNMREYWLQYSCVITLSLISTSTLADDNVWFWYRRCGDIAMTLVVTFDRVPLYRETIPICKTDRTSVPVQDQQRKIDFSFTPSRTITWTGYRDGVDTTGAGVPLRGNLWQAGADADDLLIGVTFDDVNGAHTNTLHIAYPDKTMRTEVAPGLAVSTSPARAAKSP